MPYLATDVIASETPPETHPSRVLSRAKGAAEVVAAACPQALTAGVRIAMPTAEARAIVPEVAVSAHDPVRCDAALRRLARWADRFSPVVEAVSPDVLLLEVSGCGRLFRGEENLVRQVRDGLTKWNIASRAAIADTVGAAWALAHASPSEAVVTPVGAASANLVGLPPAVLRLEERTTIALDQLGIRTVGDLLMLPRASLPARFGSHLVLRLRQLLGEVAEPIGGSTPPVVYSAGFALGPTDRLEVLLAALERVVAELCAKLNRDQVAARMVWCVVYFEDREPVSRRVALSKPSREARHLHNLLVVHLERVDLSGGVVGLRVTGAETAVRRAVQEELFAEADRPDAEEVGALLDRLANRLGEQAVVRAEMVDDHQPEKAFRYVRIVDQRGNEARRQRGDQAERGREVVDDRDDTVVGRPLRLFATPRLVRVIAVVPEGPPKWFCYQGREYVVTWAVGPERLETGWWRGADVRRDYFQVSTADGGQFWLFRDLKSNGWYVHGCHE